MNDDTMQLLVIVLMEELSVRKHRFQRDNEVAIQDIILAIVEGDDVRIVVVLQVFTIDSEDMLVIAEQVAYLTDLLAIGGSNTADPSGGLTTLDVGELDIFGRLSNHLLFDYLTIYYLFLMGR